MNVLYYFCLDKKSECSFWICSTDLQAPPVLYFVSQKDAETQRDKMARRSFNVPNTSFKVASVPLKIAVEQVFSKLFGLKNQKSLSFRIDDHKTVDNFGEKRNAKLLT